jgi:hypothetical protein
MMNYCSLEEGNQVQRLFGPAPPFLGMVKSIFAIERMNPSLALITSGSHGFQRVADFIGLVRHDSQLKVARVQLP